MVDGIGRNLPVGTKLRAVHVTYTEDEKTIAHLWAPIVPGRDYTLRGYGWCRIANAPVVYLMEITNGANPEGIERGYGLMQFRKIRKLRSKKTLPVSITRLLDVLTPIDGAEIERRHKVKHKV